MKPSEVILPIVKYDVQIMLNFPFPFFFALIICEDFYRMVSVTLLKSTELCISSFSV